MPSHTVELEYGGTIHTTFTAMDVAAGTAQPMKTIDDAEYWFGEQFTDEKGALGIATDLQSGQKTYFACCATSWDRSGSADEWESFTTQNRAEADRFIARYAILNGLAEQSA